jgi:hypothetical protein
LRTARVNEQNEIRTMCEKLTGRLHLQIVQLLQEPAVSNFLGDKTDVHVIKIHTVN